MTRSRFQMPLIAEGNKSQAQGSDWNIVYSTFLSMELSSISLASMRVDSSEEREGSD